METWTTEEFTERLRAVGRELYHDKHPFHRLMNEGALNRDQLRLWVANRFYYQENIPIKDAILLSRCPDRAVRRIWLQRIMDHDGTEDVDGGIDNWIRLGEAVGLTLEELESGKHLLPGVRHAVDAYLNFVRSRSWLEGVASSLIEIFAPDFMAARLRAFENHYTWIDPAALQYFRLRLPQSTRDSDYALALVLERCQTRRDQERAINALSFRCECTWSQLDALYYHCVSPIGQTTDPHRP